MVGAPALGSEFAVNQDSSIVLGNHIDKTCSFQGVLHYVALYSDARAPAVVAGQAGALLASDDRP